jgi:uncharacterized membrane protein YozB (DUF420 family)
MSNIALVMILLRRMDVISSGRKLLVTSLFLLLVAAFSLVVPVFGDVPVVNSGERWTRSSDNHTILNITVTHSNYFGGHYVDWIQVDVSGTINTVDLSPPQPVNLPFVVQYDLGLVSDDLTVRVMAHCNIHGSSVWSGSVDVGEVSRVGGLFNPNATVQADANLLFQIAVFLVLAAGLLMAKAKRSFKNHGSIMGTALGLHTISILIVMVPSMLASRGLFEDLFAGLALVVLSHAILGSLVEILGIYVVGMWAVNRAYVRACSKRKRTMQAMLLLWLIELLMGVYAYVLLYAAT